MNSKTSKADPQVGIGIDIESVDRFRKEMPSSRRFFSRTFTAREMAYCISKANPSTHFAGTFAAKEAALKALRIYRRGRLSITDFEVSHGKNGAPKVRYTGTRTEIGAIVISVSISHTTDNAVAVALSFLHGRRQRLRH